MDNLLRVSKPERCIGCGLCVLEAGKNYKSNRISVSNSPIRVVGKPGNFKIIIDYGIPIDSVQIEKLCPRGCFETDRG